MKLSKITISVVSGKAYTATRKLDPDNQNYVDRWSDFNDWFYVNSTETDHFFQLELSETSTVNIPFSKIESVLYDIIEVEDPIVVDE